jgi:hypothetical protein
MAEKLKPGQPITVMLTEDHKIEGDTMEHQAKFVRLHGDGEWCDVDLEKEHAGGVKRLSVPLSQVMGVILLLFALAAPARAQDIGNVGLRTVNATLANGTSCTGAAQNFTTGVTPNFNNLGQTSHLATATSNASQFQMEIDGIDNLGNVFRLSDLQLGVPTSAKGGLVVTAAGYMPQIRVSVICTAAATFSISYSGSFSPQPPNISGALLVAVDKLPFQTAAANTTVSTTFQTPGGNSSGTIIFQYAAAGPSGSTITAQCLSNNGTNLAPASVFPVTTASTPQFFTVTPMSCPFVTLTYTSGGASATTYNLEYVFNVAGTQQTLNTANSGPSSTSALQVVADSLSQSFTAAVNTFTNPGALANVLQVNANNGARNLYFDKGYVSCTAACTVVVEWVSTVGTGCGAAAIVNTKLASSVTSTAVSNSNCATTQPTGQQNIFILDLAATSSFNFDLRGLIAPAGTTNGLSIQPLNALTGTMRAQLTWYEK